MSGGCLPSTDSSGLAWPAWSSTPEWGNSCGSTSLQLVPHDGVQSTVWSAAAESGGSASPLIHGRGGRIAADARDDLGVADGLRIAVRTLLGMVRYTISGMPSRLQRSKWRLMASRSRGRQPPGQ